jgi:hypothetical protein
MVESINVGPLRGRLRVWSQKKRVQEERNFETPTISETFQPFFQPFKPSRPMGLKTKRALNSYNGGMALTRMLSDT